MPDGNANEISVDQQVANTLASQLANENLQLRQAIIRADLEKDQLQAKVDELEALTGAAKEASSKKK